MQKKRRLTKKGVVPRQVSWEQQARQTGFARRSEGMVSGSKPQQWCWEAWEQLIHSRLQLHYHGTGLGEKILQIRACHGCAHCS